MTKTKRNTISFKPTRDRVLVRMDPAPVARSAGGIELPSTVRQRVTGVVVAVGPGDDYGGKVRKVAVPVGAHVVCDEHYGSLSDHNIVTLNGETFLIVSENSVLGVLS
jgi:co-chaperonin GroES (HSP10)